MRLIFFGNYFYGLCAVALSAEACIQQHYPASPAGYYLVVFLGAIVYYSLAYLNGSGTPESSNLRAAWYARRRRPIIASLLVYALACTLIVAAFIYHHPQVLTNRSLLEYALWAVFPLVALFYYGIDIGSFKGINLRSIGWLKPFLIGFVWAGVVTVYPVLFHHAAHNLTYTPDAVAGFLFLKNFMFITVLGIMFDIKDYDDDTNAALKTFVVKNGIRTTIRRIIIPLLLLGIGLFTLFGVRHGFPALRILTNLLPFGLTIALAAQLERRQSIFFYLIFIDGLMLVKAGCGVLGMCF